MSFLLPSDMGRLIYGYLQTSCSEELAEEFLNTSDSMEECRRYRHEGFNAKVHDRTLTQMLNEYSLLSDLIFDHCDEKEKSHFNVVNTLQNLLNSKVPSSSASFDPTNTILVSPDESRGRRSECVENLFTDDSIQQVRNLEMSNTHFAARGNNLVPETLSLPTSSPSVPTKDPTLLSNSAEISINRGALTMRGTVSGNSTSTVSVPMPLNEEQLLRTPNPNVPASCGSSPPLEDSTIAEISTSITTNVPEISATYAASTRKLMRKSDENFHDTITSNIPPQICRSVSPISFPVSSVQSMSCNRSLINDLRTPTKNVPCTPTQNNVVSEKNSSNFDVILSSSAEIDSSKGKSAERKRTPQVQSANTETMSSTTVKDSPQRTKGRMKAISNKPRAQKSSSEVNRAPTSQHCDPSKILPKLLPNKIQHQKSAQSSEKKNNLQLTPRYEELSEHVPWDYGLRRSIMDNTISSVNSSDTTREPKNNRSRKHCDSNEKSLNTSNSKRKHEKNSVSCKKQKKLDVEEKLMETKTENVENKCINVPNPILENGNNLCEVTPDENINVSNGSSEKILIASPPKTTPLKNADPESSDHNTTVNEKTKNEEYSSVRREVSEEIVLFCKDSSDSKEVSSSK